MINCLTLAQLYQYFDELVSQDATSDELFASSYIRGFIALSASQFGDEEQALTPALAEDISTKMKAARSELSPEDRAIVNDYWLELQQSFNG